jgi:S-adenosylmethionine decarboxylase
MVMQNLRRQGEQHEGREWLIDAVGCRPAALRSVERLRALCEAAIRELDLHVVESPLWRRFPEPGGVTGLYLLAESHLACHTFPESGRAALNLYCCRPRPDWDWAAKLREALGARRVRVRRVRRTGLASPVAAGPPIDQEPTP